MPAPPDAANYSIGKGQLWIATFSGGAPGSYSRMGNCPSIEVEPTIERLPHYSSQAQFRQKDKNPIIQSEYVVTFDCDEIATANLNKFLMGNLSSNVVQMLQGAEAEYALRFISNNPVGHNYRWDFWKGTLGPNGPMQLIGEEWMVMSFRFEGLSDTTNQAASPYGNVTRLTTTTTTTTT